MKVTKKTKKNAGFIVSLELLLISTILVIGLITGLAQVRDAVVSELEDTAAAINQIDQTYFYSGLEGFGQIDSPSGERCINYTAGSLYLDDPEDDGAIYCVPPRDNQ